MIGDNGRLQYLKFCLFELYVNVVFVIRCLYSAVSLTLVREQRFIRIIDDDDDDNTYCTFGIHKQILILCFSPRPRTVN